jgi:hypothetical protein
MKVYTTPNNNRTHIPKKYTILDVTLETGDPSFIPSQDIRDRYKSGAIDQMKYVDLYYSEMRTSFDTCKNNWKSILGEKDVVIIYPDHPSDAVHLDALIQIISKICTYLGVHFEDEGELQSVTS